MNKIKKEAIDIFLHLTTFDKIHMRGLYKKILLYLLKCKTFKKLRKKHGRLVANKLMGNYIFDFNINKKKFLMTDNNVFPYLRNFLKNKIYEPSLTLQLINLFEKNKTNTFIDIGSHYGYFTLIAGKWLQERGQVISIEPNQIFYQKLNKNISLNNLNCYIKTFNLGLYDNDRFAEMGGWNNRRTVVVDDGEIPLVTFDSLCEKEKISPDIIKIDVHGAEGKILSGMPKVLKKNVSHLFCELHKDMNGYTSEDIVRILEDSGLYVYEFTEHRSELGGKIIPISDEFHSDYVDRMIYATRQKVLHS